MQAALTFEQSKQRSLLAKQVVGLATALIASALLPPINMEAVRNTVFPQAAGKKDGKTADIVLPQNLEIMPQIEVDSDFFPSQSERQIARQKEQKALKNIRTKITSSVLAWQGIKYQWGGNTRSGIDCSGLVQQVFRDNGIKLPRTSYDQFKKGVGVPRTKLEAGDLVFFTTNGAGASHVGIYLGEGQFISATKNCVEIQSLDQPYWSKAYRGSKRIIMA